MFPSGLTRRQALLFLAGGAAYTCGPHPHSIAGQPKQPLADPGYYTLHPRQGYGPFKFGSPIEENRHYESIYGERRERSFYPSEEVLQFFAMIMEQAGKTPEEIEASVANLKANSQSDKELYQITFGTRIDLLFKKNRLIEIAIDKGHFQVFLNGSDLFLMDGSAMVDYVARYLNENPYVDNDDIYFREHSIMIFGYSAGVENGSVKWKPPHDPRNASDQRTIVIYDGPRRASEDFTGRFIYKVI